DSGGGDLHAALIAAHWRGARLQVPAGQRHQLRSDNRRRCWPDGRRRGLGHAAAALRLPRSRLYRQQPMDRAMSPVLIPPRLAGLLGLAAAFGLLIGLTGAYVPGEPEP